MLHSIPANQHGPFAPPMTHAVETCVHCGFCLAACPTYRELGQEMDTPRGRIVLMRQVLEGNLPWDSAQPHIDRCLGCLACEPACPSGVRYRELVTPFRALAEAHWHRPIGQKLRRFLALQTIPFPNRFRIAARLGRPLLAVRSFWPKALAPMLDLLPSSLPRKRTWPPLVPASGECRGRVALLLSCAGQVLAPDIDSATIDVLGRNGVEVLIPPDQSCCGGLAWHTGHLRQAQAFARRNVNAFPKDVDAILSTAAGCGSTLREYQLVLRGTADEKQAAVFSEKALDVTVYLSRLGLRETPRGFGRQLRVAYHDACHLANAQNVRLEPRALVASIPGVEICELAGADICCGSAGTYNLDQPGIAASLGRRKAEAISGARPDLVVTGNIGCLVQLQAHLRKLGSRIPIRHTMQLLRDAYGCN